MEKLKDVQTIELFHVAFLDVLPKRVDRRRYILKGGANLRYFFGSLRYSEDLDLDLTDEPPWRLREKVDAIRIRRLAVSPAQDRDGGRLLRDPPARARAFRRLRRQRSTGLRRRTGEGDLRHHLCSRGGRWQGVLHRALSAAGLRSSCAQALDRPDREPSPGYAGLATDARGAEQGGGAMSTVLSLHGRACPPRRACRPAGSTRSQGAAADSLRSRSVPQPADRSGRPAGTPVREAA